jgi:hypothetical protein
MGEEAHGAHRGAQRPSSWAGKPPRRVVRKVVEGRCLSLGPTDECACVGWEGHTPLDLESATVGGYAAHGCVCGAAW